MFGWSERATKAEEKYRIGGENPARVIAVGHGHYEVTIPDDPEADITYQQPHYKNSDPRQTFPNMEVRDGEMRLPLEDIVSAVLARVAPAEIAVALWGDNEVREQFVYAMTTRYSEMNVGDSDRRAFLRGVKEAVHSKALDALASAASKLEYEFGKKWFFYHEVNRVNDQLHEAGYTDRDGNPIRLHHEDSDRAFAIGGATWNDARDHWREEALRLFPAQSDSDEHRNGEDAASRLSGEAMPARAEGIAQPLPAHPQGSNK